MKKTWINVFVDAYDQNQYYVSKTYGSKTEALTSVRKSMKDRYIATLDLSVLLFPKAKRTRKTTKPVFAKNPHVTAFVKEMSEKLNKIMYRNPTADEIESYKHLPKG